MPLSPTRTIRVFRYSMYFNGIDGYARISHNDILIPINELTIEGWFYFIGLREFGSIVGKSIRVHHYLYWVYTTDDNRLCSSIYTNVVSRICTDKIVTRFKWCNFFVVWRYPGEERIYLDTRLVRIAPSVKENIDTGGDITIGELRPGRLALFRGYISTIRIYRRELTDTERMHNYQYPWNPVRNGLIMWLMAHPDYIKDIDGDGVLEWIDLSGNSNHAKLYGASLVELVKSPTRKIYEAVTRQPSR